MIFFTVKIYVPWIKSAKNTFYLTHYSSMLIFLLSTWTNNWVKRTHTILVAELEIGPLMIENKLSQSIDVIELYDSFS